MALRDLCSRTKGRSRNVPGEPVSLDRLAEPERDYSKSSRPDHYQSEYCSPLAYPLAWRGWSPGRLESLSVGGCALCADLLDTAESEPKPGGVRNRCS